jgi:hypothetical protein
MSKHGMVDERIACMKRCTHASVRRMGPQIPCPRHCPDLAVASKPGDLDRAERGLQWLPITYALTYAI